MDGTLATAIISGISVILGIALTKGIDAINKYRKQSSDECHIEDERADRSYREQIANLREDLRVQKVEMQELRREMNTLASEHLNCEKTQAEMRSEIAFLRRQLNRATDTHSPPA